MNGYLQNKEHEHFINHNGGSSVAALHCAWEASPFTGILCWHVTNFQTDLSNSTYSFFHFEVKWSWVFTNLSFLVSDMVMRIHSNLNLTVCMMTGLRGHYMKCKQDCHWLLLTQMQTEKPDTLPGCQKDSKSQHISTNSSLTDNLWLYRSIILRLYIKKTTSYFSPLQKK